MARRVPLNRSLTLTTANTIYNLYTLLQATFVTSDGTGAALAKKAQTVIVQVDVGAGAAKVAIGEQAVTLTNCGWSGVATQVYQVHGYTNNLIRMDDIYLTADTNSTQVNVTVVTR